jgi:4-hydroxy-tetrahydrodipicolinate synthase
MIEGVMTALVTPFNKDGSVDFGAFETLVEEQIQRGIHGLVPMGTTGESPTLDYDEHTRVIEATVRVARGRVPVVAGTGSNSTEEAIMLTRRAKEAGAVASLQVVPYYNKPNQEGLYQHFMTIMDEVQLPIIVYNIAGRTGRNLETDTLMRLAKHPLCVGVKEASGDLPQMMDVLARRGDNFSVLSGDDNLTYPLLALGGNGVISVVSHLIPEVMVNMYKAVKANNFTEARHLHFKYLKLMKTIFIDVNPLPVKTALAIQGKFQEKFRLPLCPLDQAKKDQLIAVLKEYSLL